jgi:hypothetical protein
MLALNLADQFRFGGSTFVFGRTTKTVTTIGGLARYGGTLLDFVDWGLATGQPLLKFEFSVSGPHWEFACYHVEARDWAMWRPFIGPHNPFTWSSFHITFLPCHLATYCMDCHVVVRTATWHFLIGPYFILKMSKMSDTWQPLVLPHQHVDVIMTCVTL